MVMHIVLNTKIFMTFDMTWRFITLTTTFKNIIISKTSLFYLSLFHLILTSLFLWKLWSKNTLYNFPLSAWWLYMLCLNLENFKMLQLIMEEIFGSLSTSMLFHHPKWHGNVTSYKSFLVSVKKCISAN